MAWKCSKKLHQCHSLLHEALTTCVGWRPRCSDCRDYLQSCRSGGPDRPEESFPQQLLPRGPSVPDSSRGRDESEGPSSLSRADPTTARPVVGGPLCTHTRRKGPGFLSPHRPSPAAGRHRNSTQAPPPGYRGLWPLLPASRMRNSQQELKRRPLLLPEGLGREDICPWILESPVLGHLRKAQLARGDMGWRAGRRESSPELWGYYMGWRGC